MNLHIEELRKKANALPDLPGVYIMKNSSGSVIYIGKAKKLKNRVSQNFNPQNKHTEKVRKMVENVASFDYLIVATEFEALVLECSLIKQYKPKYNILLKDDKGYSYLKVCNKGWKSISAVLQKDDDDCVYYGPFMSSDYVNSAVKQAADIFMLPHCSKSFPQDIKKRGRTCLNYHLKLCSGACAGLISEKENNRNVEDALRFVLGEKNEIIKEFRKIMEEASENLEFEKAAKYRDKIKAIEKVSQKQHVVDMKYKNQDIFGVVSIDNKTCVNVISVRNGTIVNTDNFILDRIDESDEDYIQIITNYYSIRTDIPDRVCIEYMFDDSEIIMGFLSEVGNKKVVIYHPKSGEGQILVNMAKKNAIEKLTRVLSSNDKKKAVLHDLKELLGLDKIPEYIESYDISNTNGNENVCGMVVFKNGRPYKKAYRRFGIKSFEGQDDYRSLAEVLSRRIDEYYMNVNSDKSFGVKPDLILLDGGIGQVNAVKKVFEEKEFDVPLFGMVKDNKHRTRAIASSGKELTINDNRSLFTFVSDIQEEVHRFAITYHRTLKQKNTLISTLTAIPGIGEKRAKKLLSEFGSIAKIKEADIDSLMKVDGVSESVALLIYNYFR